MKNRLYILTFILLFYSQNYSQDGGSIFTYSPFTPKTNTIINIIFNSKGTKSDTAKNVKAIVYSAKFNDINAEEVPMVKTQSGWSCNYSIPDTSLCLGVKFICDGATIDDEKKCFLVFVYGSDGKILNGSRASASCLIDSKGPAALKPDYKLAFKLLNEELSSDPLIFRYVYKNAEKYRSMEDSSTVIQLAKKSCALLASQNVSDEKAYLCLERAYGAILKDKEKANYYIELLKKNYPLSVYWEELEYREITKLMQKDAESAEKLILEYKAKYPQSKYSELLESSFLISCSSRKNLDKINETFHRLNNRNISDPGVIIAISSIAQKIVDLNTPLAKEMIDTAIAHAENFNLIKRPSPCIYTASQYNEMFNNSAVIIFYNAARVYYKLKKPQEAFTFIQRAYSNGILTDEGEILRVRLLLELKQPSEALKITETLLIKGKKENEIKTLNREAYKLVKSSEEGYNSYIEEMIKKNQENLSREITANMINSPAPDFEMYDLENKKVSLASLKGKIVILDFWATWCGPCKASFPYMKEAVLKYAKDNNVVFLFVNTLEKESGQMEKAKSFITSAGYPFHTVLDANSNVAGQYGIEGIPTKIFIDKKGNLRYFSEGFHKENILEEIDMIIEMLEKE